MKKNNLFGALLFLAFGISVLYGADLTGSAHSTPLGDVGIIMSSGSSVQAMSNSSSQRKPRYHDANYMPISKVMRKC